jgi:spermidine synthase
MERVLAGLTVRASPIDSPIAALYASNTLGALLGVLATAFWLVPTFGLARTAAACALLNLLCAGIALALAPKAVRPAQVPPATASAPVSRRAWPLLAATGFLGIAYEVLVVRVLSQVTENTVYTFAMLLAIYLLGTAAGAAVYAKAAARWMPVAGPQAHAALRDKLVAAVAWACLLGTATLWGAEALRDGVLAQQAADSGTPVGMGWALAAEALPALLAFALPTLAMGALFSHLATQARQVGTSLGTALGANTLGAAAAPPLVAHIYRIRKRHHGRHVRAHVRHRALDARPRLAAAHQLKRRNLCSKGRQVEHPRHADRHV